MTKEVKEPVVDGEFTEVEEGKPQNVKPEIKCAITVGMTEAGDLFFNVDGKDQSLVNMDGLVKYAERHMDNVWAARLAAAAQAQQNK
jgi:hypothetical protein